MGASESVEIRQCLAIPASPLASDAKATAILSEWPVPRPRTWLSHVNRAETPQELEALRRSVQRGQPFGSASWQTRTAKRLFLESTLRSRGRPRREGDGL